MSAACEITLNKISPVCAVFSTVSFGNDDGNTSDDALLKKRGICFTFEFRCYQDLSSTSFIFSLVELNMLIM